MPANISRAPSKRATCATHRENQQKHSFVSVCLGIFCSGFACCSWAGMVASDIAVVAAGTCGCCTASSNVNVIQQWLLSSCRWAAQEGLSWSPSGAGGGGAWGWTRKRSSVSLQVGTKGRLPPSPKVHLPSGFRHPVLRLMMRQVNCALDLSAATPMCHAVLH